MIACKGWHLNLRAKNKICKINIKNIRTIDLYTLISLGYYILSIKYNFLLQK